MSFATPPPASTVPPVGSRGLVLGPDDGEAFHWLGTLTLTKVLGSVTGGGLDIVDHRVPPGYAPPLHVHRVQDEVFYLIAGTMEVTCGDEHWHVEPGSLVFLPRGIAHGFVAGDDGPARTLLINAPAGFADVIVELGVPTTGLALPDEGVAVPGPERIAEVSARHGIGPPQPTTGQ